VTATGTPPLYYSWYFDATNLVQNGTDSSLNVTNMSASNTGQYTVVITNAYASVTSRVATLAFPPSLITQPGGLTVLPGTNVSFSVTAGGTGPFTYQWQFNSSNLPNNIIITIAGDGSATYAGDGGAAINASLHNPYGVALDLVGNLYIADYSNQRIRKVDTNGIITTVAGNGSATFAGDGGAATNASLDLLYDVALDAPGNLYIADGNNLRIRKVDTNGIITTVAGGGSGGDGGAATNASLNYPYGVALDAAGNLYIADTLDQRIRKVDTNGIITTVAGDGEAIYAGDGGAATNASLNYPFGVNVDVSGNL
jgi:sugar lactone lactonase YvrE